MNKTCLCFIIVILSGFRALANHQYCTTARVVCNIGDTPSEGSLCNSSCSGNNNLVNGANSCFSGGLTRWGFYMFSIEQAGTLTFTINPEPPGFFDDGDYNFALFDVTSGCGSIGNALRCSKAYNSSDPAANTGLNGGATDTTEGTGGDGWLKYLNAECGHTYILCLDIPNNDGNGFSLSFGGTCTFGAPSDFTASEDTVCAGQPVTFAPTCNTSNAFITYQWNFGPNATPGTATGATPPAVTFSTNGPQTVTLTSTFTAGSSCVGSSNQTILVSSAAPTSDFEVTSPVCIGTNTTVTYTGNASGTAAYNWNFGGGNILSGNGQGPYTIGWPGTGTYIISLDVTDCATPSPVTTDTVIVYPSPTANAGADDTICAGSSTNLSASGGTQYSWLPSTGLSCSLCQNPSANPAGTTTYTVAVMDVNGCVNTDALTITVNPLPLVNAGPDVAICFSDTTALSGSGGVSYAWSPGSGLSGTTVSNPLAFPTATTPYSLTVTDANGCTNTDGVVVTVNNLPPANAGSDVAICNGDITNLNASGGVSYSWSPPTGLSSTTIANPSANPTATTTYSVTVTDGNSCTAVDAVMVTVNQLPPANAGSDQSICNGDSVTLNATGGIGYTWSPATGLSSTVIANPISFPTGTTTYSVTVSDGVCSASDAVIVTVNPVPVASLLSQTDVDCYNGTNGNATIQVSSGTAPYTFLWNPTGQTLQTATGLAAGSYTVSVTDAKGCTASASVTITQPPPFTATTIKSDVTCYGYNDGFAAVTVNGGTPSYTYLWLPGNGTNPTATGLSSGTYTILVTDASGCTVTSSAIITQPSLFTVTAGFTNVTCNGFCDGTGTVAGTGGTFPYTFDWSNGTMNSATVNNLCPGNYSVIAADSNGCLATSSGVITEPALLAASSLSVNILCSGDCSGSSAVNVSGGTPPYSYTWTGGGTGSSSTGLCDGTYTVTVTDNNGCTDTTISVITEPAPLSIAPSVTSALCYNQCNGSVSVAVTGGITPYTYSWIDSSSDDTIAGACAGTYTVTVTDNNGCTISGGGTVTQPTALSSTQMINNALCSDQCTGSAAVIMSGGTGAYAYLWNTGETTVSLNNICAGTFTVTVTDANGCTLVDFLSVQFIPGATVTTDGDTISCNFNGTQILALGSGTFQWSPPEGLTGTAIYNPFANPDSVTTYTVIMTDQYGCKDTASITVRQSVATADAGPDVEINYGNSNPVYATGGGTYQWTTSTGSQSGLNCYDCQNPVASPEQTTTYYVTVTNGDGCTATDSLVVTVNISDVIFVPDVFSPNGDGKNDILYIRAAAIKELTFAVYDRWGEKVFETTDKSKGWNGEFRGSPADAAVYVYYVKATLVNNQEIKLKGDVTLMR